jgi:hypothetical protein
VDNRPVHLPGEHPAAGGEDLRPQGDGVGDVALILTSRPNSHRPRLCSNEKIGSIIVADHLNAEAIGVRSIARGNHNTGAKRREDVRTLPLFKPDS